MVVTKERDIGFDLIRSLSALWIVCVWHLLAYADSEINFTTIPFFCAELALSCFMFISGYFLGQKTIKNKADVLEFYKKRFWRFYILFLISAIILLVGGLFSNKMWFQTPESFFSTILGLSSFVDPSVGTIWFMSMLMMFYLLTPLILYGERNSVRRIVVATALYLLFVLLYFTLPSVDFRLLRFFPMYSLGLLMTTQSIDIIKKSHFIVIIAAVICVFLSVIPLNIENQHISVVVSNMFYLIRFFSAIIVVIWIIDILKLSGGGQISIVY